ncbi:hypothetical protein DY251_07720 [Mesorhizobium denitrificans]|uniref:Uncharacterized protein n=1 Tax=Mesorhizobium denitrificans TaxID=2294114 RepID=A0A371XGH7_9HYPH|nr:hypothetical protein DY251_07720 [Mesorhizobium denitrificans]
MLDASVTFSGHARMIAVASSILPVTDPLRLHTGAGYSFDDCTANADASPGKQIGDNDAAAGSVLEP